MKAQIRHFLSALMILAVVPILGIKAVYSQSITPATDTSTTISSPVHNPHQFDIGGGTRAGANLFHSFQRFGLSQGQIANFLSNAEIQTILARVMGGNPSVIQGLLQVSGGQSNLFLMNPAGIIFGPDARLNVPAAFVATTANGIGIGNGWFNAIGPNDYGSLVGTPNSFAFLGPDVGAIFNAGVLRSGAGHSITLLGGTVVNTGTIEAPGGTITIAAIPGQRLVRITQAGSLLSLVLPTEAANALNSPSSAPFSLPALLTGGALPEATGVRVENGVVSLISTGQAIPTAAGATTVSGTLSTATPTAPSNPAQIQVVGDRVALLNAQLDASGPNGGLVRIGGDYQGLGTLPKARITEVDANTIIRADGTGGTGHGGTVVIWSTDTTHLAGTITATGAISGGNGGLVETSSQGTLMLAPTARINTHAPQGQTGTWLLDPPDLTVTANGDAILSGGPPLTNTPTTATTIRAGAIAEGLALNQVNLQASNSITVDAAIDASLNPVANNLTLTTPTAILNQPITLATGGTLSGTATTVTINPGAVIQNGVDVAAPGGTVNVAAGTYHVPGVANQVSITKPVTVQGAETTIIDGGGVSRGIYVDPGSDRTVNLDRLTIQQGHVEDYGAGILVNIGTLNLTNSTLRENSSRLGGGIFNRGTANVTNSTINSNSAIYGGGIANSGTVTLNSSIISNNVAADPGSGFFYYYSYGGGIYNNGTINLINSTISNNSSVYIGGGISNNASFNYRGTISLVNSTLSHNSAGDLGGGINNFGTVTFIDSSITENSAKVGGGINNYFDSTVTLTNSILSHNSAINGGGISNGGSLGGYSYNGGIVNLNNSTLSRNSASNSGGGINNHGTVTLNNSILSHNSAINGGGIFNTVYSGDFSGRVNLNNSVLTDNSAINNGGGISNSDGTVNLTNSTISRSSANKGGAIFNGGTVNLTSSTISSNLATKGAGIFNDGYTYTYFIRGFPGMGEPPFIGPIKSTLIGKVTITNSTLSSNSATDLGGSIYNAGTMKVNSSTIANNSANSGGGIFNAALTPWNPWNLWKEGWLLAGTLTVKNSIIAGNLAGSGRELANLGSSTSEGYNLFGFNASSGVEGMAFSPTDIVPSVGIAQILAPLGNYGGPTQTHALVPRSPAINAGDPNLLTPDQRGFARLGRADIGAFEFQPVIRTDAPPVRILSSVSINLSASDLYEIVAALYGREPMPLTVKLQPELTPILCIDRTASETWHPLHDYQGLPDCQ